MENTVLSTFSQKADPKFQEIVRRLVAILHTTGYPLDMDIKWGQLTFAYHSDFHHWICAIKITKKSVGLVFHFGGLLDDPGGLFKSGSSKFLRSLEYQSVEEIDEAVIHHFIAQALDRLPYFKENWKQIQKSK